jgi:hypothetical protein
MARHNDTEKEYQTYDQPAGETVLEISDKKVVQAEFSEWEGQKYWNLRIWFQKRDGTWQRGKGLSIPSAMAREMIGNLNQYVKDRADRAKARRR